MNSEGFKTPALIRKTGVDSGVREKMGKECNTETRASKFPSKDDIESSGK